MSRFLHQATDAGVVLPRSGSSPARPAGRATAARILGAAGMLTLTILLFWLLTDESFRVSEAGVRIAGLRLVDEGSVRDRLAGLDRSPNVFRIRAAEIVGELRDLPAVGSASASVSLPASVSIAVEERKPLFRWSDGSQVWLVDGEGRLIAPGALAAAEGSGPPDGQSAGAGPLDGQSQGAGPPDGEGDGSGGPPGAGAGLDLPVVEDARLVDVPPAEGARLPAMDLAVMRQLLALTPELLGSRASLLQLRVDEHDGYVLQSDRGWQAIFGHYTPTLQPAELVPRQVQCLTWLLASHERQLERVRLTVSESTCGTFTEIGRPG